MVGRSHALRILYLHQHFSTPDGATATRSHAMAMALAARGHAVTVLCGRYAGAVTGLDGPFRARRRQGTVGRFQVIELDIPCANAHDLRARAGAFLHYAARATAIACTGGHDVIIASSTPLTVLLPALAARATRRTPFVFEIRDPWPELPRALLAARQGSRGPSRLWAPVWAGMGALASLGARHAHSVVALSEGMAETAIARGADPARVAVVPNGCDLHLFGPAATPWRPSEIPPWAPIAVYAGTHGPANGLDGLLDAAAWLQTRRDTSPVHLLLIGEGAEKARLTARALREGLAAVHFLPPLPKRRLAGLLAGSQIGVHCLAPEPAFAEWTAPNKLMDYLAAGLPVITNLAGRAARLLAEGPAGLSVPAGDAAAFGTALAALAADPGRRAAMGQAGRALAERRWDRARLAAQFCAVVERAAPRDRRPAAATATPEPTPTAHG